jgi:hypothetical protein
MERRAFIKSISLLSLGMMVNPSFVMSSNEGWELLTINSQIQIRHGLLSLNSVNLQGGNWRETLQKNIFYKNGYSSSPADLTLYSFKQEGVNYLIGIKEGQLNLTVEGETIEISIEEESFSYQHPNGQIEIKFGDQYEQMDMNHEYLVLPIMPATSVDRYSVKEGEALKIAHSNQTIRLDKKAIVIKTKKLLLS